MGHELQVSPAATIFYNRSLRSLGFADAKKRFSFSRSVFLMVFQKVSL